MTSNVKTGGSQRARHTYDPIEYDKAIAVPLEPQRGPQHADEMGTQMGMIGKNRTSRFERRKWTLWK
jgi:hypothetical protein